MPSAVHAVDTNTMRTVLLRNVLKSKKRSAFWLRFFSFTFRRWFFKCNMARRCGWYNEAERYSNPNRNVRNTVTVIHWRPSLRVVRRYIEKKRNSSKLNHYSRTHKEEIESVQRYTRKTMKLPPTKSCNGLFKVYGHESNAHSTARHNDHLDKFAFLLEILCHHYGGTVPGETDTHSNYYACWRALEHQQKTNEEKDRNSWAYITIRTIECVCVSATNSPLRLMPQ